MSLAHRFSLAGPVAALAVACGPARAAEAVRLEVGATHLAEASGPIRRIAVDRQGVLSVRVVDARRVALTGLAPGEASVRLSGRSGEPDLALALTVAPPAPAAPTALEAALRADPAFQDVRAVPTPTGTALSGEVADLATHARLLRLAAALAGAPVNDVVSVTGGQMVAVDVRFYAVAANTLKSLGFNFTYLGGDIQGGLLAPGTLQSFSLSPSGLSLQAGTPLQDAFNLLLARPGSGALDMLSALSSVGLSQVLAQPTLLVRSGEAADFLAGGDVPIPVPQGGGTGTVTIEYRPYGVRLSVAPVVLSERRILLKLSPEVSELDYSNQVRVQGSGVPGFRRRSASTTVELGDGQSFVIAGLTFASTSANEARLPGLGDLPVLGALFKTSQTSRQRQELIIVATPRLVRPLDKDPLADVDLTATKVARSDGEARPVRPLDEVERLGLRR